MCQCLITRFTMQLSEPKNMNQPTHQPNLNASCGVTRIAHKVPFEASVLVTLSE